MTGARTVIIGGSHAAIAVATKLRSLSGDVGITIVSAEKDFPYQRPPLSKAYLAGKSTFEHILLRPYTIHLSQQLEAFCIQCFISCGLGNIKRNVFQKLIGFP